jgi:hypothetical protein
LELILDFTLELILDFTLELILDFTLELILDFTLELILDFTLDKILDLAFSISFCLSLSAAILIAILDPAAIRPAAPPVDAIAATFATTRAIFISFLNLRSRSSIEKVLFAWVVLFM